MSNVEFKVTLNNGSLDVDQAGNGHQMGRGKVTKITWHLKTEGGAFNALDASHKGFAWITTPPPPATVFTDLKILTNGKIRVTDHNDDPGGVNSSGSWVYQLWATIDGIEYSTIAGLPLITSTNPKIQNL